MVEVWQQNDAERHKARGNTHFKNGDYDLAIEEYRQAILKDSTNPAYYTNRAMALYKLGKYEDILNDCQSALDKKPTFKAYYYMGLAQTQLEHFKGAEKNLKRAYQLALSEASTSAASICQAILDCRKAVWKAKERNRQQRAAPLLGEIMQMYRAKYQPELQQATSEDDRAYLNEQLEGKLSDVEKVFQLSGQYKMEQEVPDYLLDPISFNLFVDPVITKSGNTFERAWILQHLQTSSTDPFSREKCTKQDLRPNYQLKRAAEEYIAEHGEY